MTTGLRVPWGRHADTTVLVAQHFTAEAQSLNITLHVWNQGKKTELLELEQFCFV